MSQSHSLNVYSEARACKVRACINEDRWCIRQYLQIALHEVGSSNSKLAGRCRRQITPLCSGHLLQDEVVCYKHRPCCPQPHQLELGFPAHAFDQRQLRNVVECCRPAADNNVALKPGVVLPEGLAIDSPQHAGRCSKVSYKVACMPEALSLDKCTCLKDNTKVSNH